jgi:glycine reductase
MNETRLELARFAVEEIAEGRPATSWASNGLTVSCSDLAQRASDAALEDVTVAVVRPGEAVRVTNVLDAIVPTVKPDDPATTFPGALGRLATAGRGRSHRLEGVRVLVTCDWEAAGRVGPDEFPPSFVDMAGPAADRSRYAEHPNVVVSCTPSSGADLREADRAVRRAGLRVARDLAATTIGAAPDGVETRIPPGRPSELPSICAVLQISSEGPLLDTYLYGQPTGGIVPTLIDPLEVIDGALTNGAYDWPGVRNATASYQDGPLLDALLAGDGERFRFAGLILALGYLNTAEDKQRSALQSAAVARLIGADGAICTTFSSGNSHTDTMLTVRALERAGVRTCAIVAETNGGLTDHVAEADCLVSVGNEDELLSPWTPERLVGGDRDAMVGEPIALRSYLGSSGETGEFDLMAVPA